MKGTTETLMKCKGFVGWKWEDEFQKALSAYKQHIDDAAVTIPYLFVLWDLWNPWNL